jgi:hypothetical protein
MRGDPLLLAGRGRRPPSPRREGLDIVENEHFSTERRRKNLCLDEDPRARRHGRRTPARPRSTAPSALSRCDAKRPSRRGDLDRRLHQQAGRAASAIRRSSAPAPMPATAAAPSPAPARASTSSAIASATRSRRWSPMQGHVAQGRGRPRCIAELTHAQDRRRPRRRRGRWRHRRALQLRGHVSRLGHAGRFRPCRDPRGSRAVGAGVMSLLVFPTALILRSDRRSRLEGCSSCFRSLLEHPSRRRCAAPQDEGCRSDRTTA